MAHNKYAVSVVMPCYNASRFIEVAIASILNQSLRDLEFIIVDDGSTDGTVGVIGQFNDPRIKLIELETNHGNYYACNVGIRAASGKYIAMFDSDDIAEGHRIETQFNYLESKKWVGAIGSNYYFINENGDRMGKMDRACSYCQFQVKLLQDNYMLQSTIMIRRHLIFKFGLLYDLKYEVASDYDFVARCSRHFPIYNIRDFLISYRFHATQISSAKRAKQVEYANAIRKTIFSHFQQEALTENYDLIEALVLNMIRDINDMERCTEILNQLLLENDKKKCITPICSRNFS